MVHGALPISELDSECMTLLSWKIFSGRVHRNYIFVVRIFTGGRFHVGGVVHCELRLEA